MGETRCARRTGWLAAGCLAAAAWGCSREASPPAASTAASTGGTAREENDHSHPHGGTGESAAASHGEEGHEHEAGAHGGVIASLGRNSYHVEAVVENGGVLRLYTLGADETRVQEVETQTLKGFVKAVGSADSLAFELQAMPQEGDAAEKTSMFVGRLPAETAGKAIEVTVPSMRIGGERFRLGFRTEAAHDLHDDEHMPAKVASDAERDLYLTAAGLYTAADVQANGNVTASEKFKDFRAKHDMNPKPGDKICPVTMTKANPACSWIVGGKQYEFCCPPCVDEFVSWAKNTETAAKVLAPEEYVKK
jgi:hypothetical protein